MKTLTTWVEGEVGVLYEHMRVCCVWATWRQSWEVRQSVRGGSGESRDTLRRGRRASGYCGGVAVRKRWTGTGGPRPRGNNHEVAAAR
jgi:hypothetical protein